jgi:hypothetical protein
MLASNEQVLATASMVKSGNHLIGSKWNNCECETIMAQTIMASANNIKDHGESFSWCGVGAVSGRQVCGTDNRRGLGRLQADGSLVLEKYNGKLSPPDDVAKEDGIPLVLRLTSEGLNYVDQLINS